MSYGFNQNEFGLPTSPGTAMPFLPKTGGVVKPWNGIQHLNNQPMDNSFDNTSFGSVNTDQQTTDKGTGLTTPPVTSGDFSYGSGETDSGGLDSNFGGSSFSSTPGGGTVGQDSSGNGAYGSSPSLGFEDGGVVPEQGQQQGVNDVSAAVQMAKQVLAQGRQQNGLPPSIFGGQEQGYADGGEVTDGGDMSDPSAGGMPEAPDAQPSPDQSAGSMPGPVAAKVFGYLKGADAVTPEVAQAMQGRVDPQGQMDPNTRTLMSIANAPQGAQWGMMQHFRQKYDAYKAFAQASANGTQGKPPDIAASTNAATQANQNLPDGNNVMFAPHPQGVQVHIQPMASGKTKGYDDGGVVTDDQDNTPLPTPDPRGPKETDDSVGEPDTDALSGAASAVKSFVMSIPQYLSYLKGTSSQYDHVMDKGVDAALSPVAQPQMGEAITKLREGGENPSGPYDPADDEGLGGENPSGPRPSMTLNRATGQPVPSAVPSVGPRADFANRFKVPPKPASAPTPAGGGSLQDVVGRVNANKPEAPAGTAPVGDFTVGSGAMTPGQQTASQQPAIPSGPNSSYPTGRPGQQGGAPVQGRFGETIQRMPNGTTKVSYNGTPQLDDDTRDDMNFTRAVFNPRTGDDPTAQRAALVGMRTARAKGESDVATEEAKGRAWAGRSEATLQRQVTVQQMKANLAMNLAREKDPQRAKLLSSMVSLVNGGMPQNKVVDTLKGWGFDPNLVLTGQPTSQQAPAPAQQAPAQRPQIPAGAIQKLKANPGKASDFDAIFGPGSSQQFLTGGMPPGQS